MALVAANMRRPLTIFALALATLGTARGAEVTTTVYVGRHFEVRDHDQPVKYVLSANTRVARITGSLSSSERIQRLRVRAGWNLFSLAVRAADLPGQIQGNTEEGAEPLLRAAYRWWPSTGDYKSLAPGETVEAGSILWLYARTNRVIAVRGEYLSPTRPTIPAGGGFVPGPGLEVWPVELPPGVSIWKFDSAAGNWQAGLPGDLAPLSNIARQISPGDAIYVHSADAVELSIPRPDLHIAYFHPDHLASSSVVTDSAGELVEETAYHPFGIPRHQSGPGGIDPHYGFTQKERDRESRLHYFEARYLAGSLARFLSFDPLIQSLEALEDTELKNLLAQPARLNPFAYALNNPVRYNDPDGRDARPRPTERKPEQPEPELTIRIGPAAKGTKELSATSFSIFPNRGNVSSGIGGGHGRGKASQPEIIITRNSDKASTELFKKTADGTHIKSLVLIIPGKDREGKDTEYQVQMKDVVIDAMSMSRNGIDGEPEETITLNAGSVKFIYPNQPEPPRETRREWTLEPRTDQ